MNVIIKIEEILSKNLILDNLIFIPKKGITDTDIQNTENILMKTIPNSLKIFLKKWNGIHLDIINIFGCGADKVEGSISSSEENQNLKYVNSNLREYLIFADDPAGYLYMIDSNEHIYVFDTKTNSFNKIASNFEDFICDNIFGKKSLDFIGVDWFQELKAAKLV